MSKYKVCVYAISKNEEKFVDRWVNSMKEADEIYVLDTGSNDKTIKKLKKNNVIVKKKIIKPWRFDIARNISLEMVPEDTDICVCTDLDEVFEPGWREKLENIWQKNTDRLQYNYNWSLDENNKPLINFYIGKIHKRNDYSWKNPVHEVITYNKPNEILLTTDEITLNHYPDNLKSRSSYLPLLELAVKEDSTNDRNMHYLGREYMFYRKYNEAIDTLIKHLKMPSSTWKDERCASMRFISRCYIKLNRYDEALLWLNKAIAECPYSRDPLVEMANLKYLNNEWEDVIYFCNKALEITYKYKNYITEKFSWDETIYDLLSIAYFYTNDFQSALININKALEINQNERLLNNKILIENKIKS